MDEFDDDACAPRMTIIAQADANTRSSRHSEIARVVSRVYRAASDAVRADMLKHLLRPLGVLGLVSVASGAFARLMRRDGLVPDPISVDDVVRYSGEQIRELAMFVHEVNPDALQALIEQLAPHGMGVAALSTAALAMLLRGSQRRPIRSCKTASGLERSLGKPRSERG